MNNKEFVKLLIVIFSTISSIIFILFSQSAFELTILFVLLFLFILSIPLYLLTKYDEIKLSKNKKKYDILFIVSLTIFIIICLLITFLYGFNIVNGVKQLNIPNILKEISIIIYYISLFAMLLISCDDTLKESNKIFSIFTVVVAIINIFIHINYLVNPNIELLRNLFIADISEYVFQCYGLIGLTNLSLIIYKYISK